MMDRTAGVPFEAAPRAFGPDEGRAHDRMERATTEALAREFEAMLLRQMIQHMRQSLLGDEDQSGSGNPLMDTLDAEFARHLGRAGGLGLADALLQALDRRGGDRHLGQPGPEQPLADVRGSRWPVFDRAASGLAAPAPAGGFEPARGRASAAVPLPLDAPVSSRFGWRRDPLDGHDRFHRGVDVRAAHGEAVPAPVGGRVLFAGRQGGYGNTVVLEHEDGVTTRYAHLSAVKVRTGQAVEAGEPLGRVGATGRATGPHLHFEVSVDGRPVDPEQAARRFMAALKRLQGSVDSPKTRFSDQPGAGGADHED